MNAESQYKISAAEMDIILCLIRTGTLAEAGLRLGVDGSTVFRTVQRIEKGLALRLFERSRSGYRPTELAMQLAQHAERIETELDAARLLAHNPSGEVAGSVHITTTDSIFAGLLLPALKPLAQQHPLLQFEISTGNQLLSLSKRDADIALRATSLPPEHLVGKKIGQIHTALYASADHVLPSDAAAWRWVGVDDALPAHPSVRWRKHQFPAAHPVVRVDTITAMMDTICMGLGVGALPVFLACTRPGLRQIMLVPDHFATQLWLLTHPDTRHLRRISTVFQHLAAHLALE